jgi:hypothetical protein
VSSLDDEQAVFRHEFAISGLKRTIARVMPSYVVVEEVQRSDVIVVNRGGTALPNESIEHEVGTRR